MSRQLGQWVLVFAVTCLATACSTPTEVPTPASQREFTDQIAQQHPNLLNWLPGFYSDYAQVIEAGGHEDDVTDLTVRKLATTDTDVFLFKTHKRSAIDATYDLYFIRLDPSSGVPEMEFARMTGSDLSKPLAETLHIGRKRALPGCTISLAQFNIQSLTAVQTSYIGKSLIDTCQFEDPLHGHTAFERSLSISENQITVTEIALKPGETLSATAEQLPLAKLFQKHQAYEGTVSVNMAAVSNNPDTTQWITSTSINFYDDGRVSKLYDTDMQPMNYAIRLSKMKWRKNEPPYLRIEAVDLKSGEALAYSWFDPESAQVDWELEWLEVHLKELDLGLE